MNPSFSTTEITVGSNNNNSSRRLPSTNIRQQSSGGGSSCGLSILDEMNLEKTARYSPSMIDSEPPSYFDVIGGGSRKPSILTVTSPSMQLPKVTLSPTYTKETQLSYTPNHRRQQAVSANPRHQLPRSLNPNQVCLSSGTEGAVRASRVSFDSIQKPCDTYLAWSIFTTVYCIFIGVPALILSIKVYHYNKQSLYQKAYSRSKVAKYLNITGLFFGFVYLGVVLLTFILPRR